MADVKSMVFAAGMALAAAAFGAIDAHRTVAYRWAVTNGKETAQTVAAAWTSCGCLKLDIERGAELAPGEALEFGATFDPTGLEGDVERVAWVTLAPSGRTETFTVSETVRLRLGLKPSGAAFGNVRREETGRAVTAELSGYAAKGARLGAPRRASEGEGKTVFDMRVGADGKSVVAKLAREDVLPGVYAETWAVPTDDAEVPELRFVASARVLEGGEVTVTPHELVVAPDEKRASRAVLVRGTDGAKLRVLSAETKPVAWGTASVSERPGGGWRVDVWNIDAGVVEELAEEPFLEIKTDVSGMESLGIPLRVATEGVVE